MSESFYVVAATSELEEGGQMYIDLEGEEILLVRHQGEFHAIAYLCSHAEFGLEGGSLHNNCITCPYHGAEFCLKTGEARSAPAWEPIRVYPVKVENDTIAVSKVPLQQP
ncbi:MAG: non-heme iron oxygenase ferredoxin subunit [Pseudomonadales bacterium]|nr:non-heme iron oxygenase ferredoxin subunit [Pseudomonadales bacterium]